MHLARRTSCAVQLIIHKFLWNIDIGLQKRHTAVHKTRRRGLKVSRYIGVLAIQYGNVCFSNIVLANQKRHRIFLSSVNKVIKNVFRECKVASFFGLLLHPAVSVSGGPQGLARIPLLVKSGNYILTIRQWQKRRRRRVDNNTYTGNFGEGSIEMKRMLIIFNPQGIFATWKLTSFWCLKLIKSFALLSLYCHTLHSV